MSNTIENKSLFINPFLIGKSSVGKNDQELKKIKKKSDATKTEFNTLFKSEIQESNIEQVADDSRVDLTEIEEMLREIGVSGESLKKEQTLENFDYYKRCIKKYLSKVLDISISVNRVSVFKRIKGSFAKEEIVKIHTKVIDKELVDLSKLFFSEQREAMSIISKIDKIQGILIDMKF